MKNFLQLIKRTFKKEHIHIFILLVIFSITSAVFTLITPALLEEGIQVIEETAVVNLETETMMFWFGLTLAAYFIGGVFQWLTFFFANKLSLKVATEIRKEIFEVVMKAPVYYLDSHQIGLPLELMATANEHIRESLTKTYELFISIFLGILISLVMMFTRSWILTLIVLGITPFILVASFFMGKRSSKINNEQQILLEELNSQSEEYISKQKLLIAYNYQRYQAHTMDNNNNRIRMLAEKSHFIGSLVNPMTRFINYLIYAVIVLVSSFLFINGNITSIATIIAFIMYSNSFAHPFDHFSEIMAYVIKGEVAYFRTMEFINDVELETDDILFSATDICQSGSIVFDDVSFSYKAGDTLIRDFSLEVRPKRKIAIVGQTGSGKSTLLNLLLRFHDINSGDIRLDGKSINSISKRALRKSYGLILQETWLFDGTIRDNIAYGNPDASMEEIIEAAKKARCHELITSLKDGYDTYIFEGDSGISAGEKQLITIARALLINPPILLLDEATSNIDSVTEVKIQDMLDEIMRNHTTFYVAHRLATIEDANLIIVMDEGKLVEYGNHKELIQKKGLYFELYNS